MLKLITKPQEPVVTVEEVKLFTRIDNDVEDTLLASMVASFTTRGEHYCGRQFVTAGYELEQPYLTSVILLPKPPVTEVKSITCLIGGEEVALVPDQYELVGNDDEAAVYIKPQLSGANVKVRFMAGWTKETLPDLIKNYVMACVATFYDDRSQKEERLNNLDTMLNPYWISPRM